MRFADTISIARKSIVAQPTQSMLEQEKVTLKMVAAKMKTHITMQKIFFIVLLFLVVLILYYKDNAFIWEMQI